MNLTDKIKELWNVKQQEYALTTELKTYIDKYVADNRKLQPGTIVEVYSDEHEFLGEGIVGDVRSCVFLEDMNIRDYANGKINIDLDLATLRYEVFAKTKDNKASKKHLFSSPHFIMFEPDFRVKRKGFEYLKLKQI